MADFLHLPRDAALLDAQQRLPTRIAPFGVREVDAAAAEWGFNCGPGALCGALGLTPNAIRPLMGDFEEKGYTTPTLMAEVLRRYGRGHRETYRSDSPGRCRLDFGVLRVQWDGPWTRPGVPMRARYRYSHWATVAGDEVFDINAISAGGWLSRQEWERELIPWLIGETCPRGNGNWWPTHGWEIDVHESEALGSGDLETDGR